MVDMNDKSDNNTPTSYNIHTKQYDDILERYGDEHGNIDFDTLEYDLLPYDDYVELSHFWSSVNFYLPKPEHLKVSYINRKFKWDETIEKLEDDVPKHRRFNLTLKVPQLTNAFKKSVKKGEVSKGTLLSIYRIVAQKLLADPSITDSEIKIMHDVIRHRVSDMYDRRLMARKRGIK